EHALASSPARAWTRLELATSAAIWIVMMLAMMLPTAAPMVLALGAIGRGQRARTSPLAPAASFVLGYAIVWTAFSIAAATLQWGAHRLAWLSNAEPATREVLSGALLLAAGAFQFSALKDACLSRCRSPLAFLMARWRPGALAALRMGIAHGRDCVGCCWALMALMFVAGSLHLLWTAALAMLMLAEKALRSGRLLGRIAGGVLMIWGAYRIGAQLFGPA
ncbi:MAG TPA: DUF2182 domain-containing protein, partial [Myxococcota bacterium]|nr:DUF2182 domain-containing protein [Myxococcota bacterium]